MNDECLCVGTCRHAPGYTDAKDIMTFYIELDKGCPTAGYEGTQHGSSIDSGNPCCLGVGSLNTVQPVDLLHLT